MFDTLVVHLKELFEKVYKNNQQTTKKRARLPCMLRVNVAKNTGHCG